MDIARSLSLFLFAGLCEIGGGYLVWMSIRDGKTAWYGIGHHVRAKNVGQRNSRRLHMSQLRAQRQVAGGSFAQGVTPALASTILDHDQ